MNNELIELQQRLIDKYLEPDEHSIKTGQLKGYKCLFCGSGTGRKGTGLKILKDEKLLKTDRDKILFSCFNCGNIKGESIFDIVIKRENISGNEKEQFAKLFEIAGMKASGKKQPTSKHQEKPTYSAETMKKLEQRAKEIAEKEEQIKKNYAEVFEYAKQNKDKAVAYLVSRSINKDYANSLENIGFYETNKELMSKQGYKFFDKQEVLIIKLADAFYYQRFLKPKDKEHRFLNSKGLHSTITNEKALLNNNIVFIVEGIFDLFSLESLGYKAIALNSTSNNNILKKYITEHRQEISKDLRVVLLCDADNAGQQCNIEIQKDLQELGIKAYIKTEILQKESVKDMNELLMKDAEKAKEVIAKAVEEVKEEVKKEKENFCLEYKKNENDKDTIKITSDREQIQNHLLRIEQPNREHITTGFKQLDDAVNKGLTTGLYIIGAKAGTGKTAFLLQVSDYIARTQKKKVLFFSLEQGKNALFNRRIARITFENMKNFVNKRQYKDFTTADFINLADFKDIEFYGEQYEKNETKDKNINNAVITFDTYAKNVFTIDDIYTVEDIEKVIMNCINQGEKPIVFIDYLQRLKPSKNIKDYGKFEDKRLFDMCIQRLKDLIKRENLVVFLVSSLNRQAKDTELNAYSGSNEIEFNAEFAGTLQIDESYYKEIAKKENKTNIRAVIDEQFKKNNYKRLKLCILKQKDGISGIDIDLKLYAKYYYYEEVEENKQQPNNNQTETKTEEDSQTERIKIY